jgi:type VI secretion system secreted protein Hcp
MAGIDSFLKLDKVTSESTKKGHEKEIDVLSWTWGASNASSLGGGGSGLSRGKAVPNDFHITHRYDSASPTIAQKCANGSHFDTAVVTCRQAGGDQQEFLKITMSHVIITNVSPAASEGGEIVEAVSMMYNKVKYEYKPMDATGKLGGAIVFEWDVSAQTVS